MYHVNPSLFHGLCENCANRLENDESLNCFRCKSRVELIFLSKNPKICEKCHEIGDVKHKNCKHYSCPACRVNENCPVCICILCKSPNFTKELCETHKFCFKCSSKFNQCPWCTCQHCQGQHLQFDECGHPVCTECLGTKCKLCSEICTFCKKPTSELKGIHCKHHFGCLECYENFISKDKRCHYCAKDYQKFKCGTCEKYFFNIKSSPQLNIDKICEECLKTQEFEAPQIPNIEVKNIPYQFKAVENGKCHYCDNNNHDRLLTTCGKGYSCRACDKYNKAITCNKCSNLVKNICEVCGENDFIFQDCKHNLCINCVEKCTLCSNLLKVSQLCVCSDSETCILCEEKKKNNSLPHEILTDCYVCGRMNTHTELKPCQHMQCQICLTDNKNKDYCSRCLDQYKCEDHNRIYFLTGEAYILHKCCDLIICKSTRKIIENIDT